MPILALLLVSVLGTAIAAKSGQQIDGNRAGVQTATQKQSRPCAVSEHTCNNGRCVPLNKYCNNVNDCGDGSDEPRFCTSKYPLFVLSYHVAYLSVDLETVAVL